LEEEQLDSSTSVIAKTNLLFDLDFLGLESIILGSFLLPLSSFLILLEPHTSYND
jgi:hypothetical protein